MLSLRSLAFILCSAMRLARALSCAALHCFPDIINERTMATNNARKMATNMAAPMCSLLRTVYASQSDHGSGRKGPFVKHGPGYRLNESSKWTPSVFCKTVRMLERLAADGLPFGPSMRMRLLAGICVRRSRS